MEFLSAFQVVDVGEIAFIHSGSVERKRIDERLACHKCLRVTSVYRS
jgi:hypothetical protein